MAGTSQWAVEGRAGAELAFRAPIGQLALRYADTVEPRARGRDDFLLEAKAAGKGRERPVWLKRGRGVGQEQQDGRGGSSAPQRDGPWSRSRRRRPRRPAALSVAPGRSTAPGQGRPRARRAPAGADAAAGPPEPEARAEPAERRAPRSAAAAWIAGRAGAAVPPAGARRRARRGVAGAGPGPAGRAAAHLARAAAAAAARAGEVEPAPALSGPPPPERPAGPRAAAGGSSLPPSPGPRRGSPPRSRRRRRGRSPGERGLGLPSRRSRRSCWRRLCSAGPGARGVAAGPGGRMRSAGRREELLAARGPGAGRARGERLAVPGAIRAQQLREWCA